MPRRDPAIYRITNTVSGKIYIGSSVYVAGRLGVHRHNLRNGKHDNSYLQRAWGKDGEESFVFEVVERCAEDQLLEREQYWLDTTRCYERDVGYNLVNKANSTVGYKHTEEMKKYFSETRRGAGNHRYGKCHSEETKKLIAEAQVGEKNHMYGKKASEETKIKLSASLKGKMAGEKNPMFGTHKTPEQKAHLSSKLKGVNAAESSGQAKLTWDQVMQIRELATTEYHPQNELAAIFGVSQSRICCILLNKSWVDPTYTPPPSR